MKSAFLVGPKKIEVREIPEPVCTDDGIILKVEACSICGSDIRRWKEGPISEDKIIVQGHEVSGTIIEVGNKVKNYSVGTRIALAPDIHCGECYYCQHGKYNLCDNLKLVGITPGYPGGFSEKMLITEEILRNGIIHEMPSNISFAEGAVAETCCSALATLKKVNTKMGDTVVIIGAGPTGAFMISIAKAMGAKVIVSQRSEYRRKIIEKFEPDYIADSKNNLKDEVAKFTNNLMADTVICANPNAETHTLAVEIVKKGGKVVLFGGLPKANPMTHLNSNLIHYGEIEVIGAFSYHPTIHAEVLELFSANTIDAKKMITHNFSLEKINEAFKIAAEGKGLKVLISQQ